MNGVLVRVGIDSTPIYGGWNAPVDEQTGHFVFVPIPDSSHNPADSYILGGKRTYDEVLRVLHRFSIEFRQPEHKGFTLPARLHGKSMHLDPDFQELTYGSYPRKGGSCFSSPPEVSFVAFYSGLRSLQSDNLVYALVGIFFLAGKARTVGQIPPEEYLRNAHTRWCQRKQDHIVVQGKHGESGLFDRCIKIGEWRGNAYRVCNNLLTEWGGLSVKDGWIQKNTVPPRFTCGKRFLDWLQEQNPRIIAAQYKANDAGV